MAERKNIEFKTTDGLTLKGWLFSAGQKSPCVIMANGLSGLIGHYLDDFAQRFQAAGFTTVLYDNRCWGISEGLPRNETNPHFQFHDYLAAFDYAVSLPEVDPGRVAYWGTSMAGGNVICAGALDRRIKAVISQIPFVSGEMVSAAVPPPVAQFVLQDRARIATGAAATMLPIIPASKEEAPTSQALLNTPDLWDFLAGLDKRGVKYESFVTSQTVLYLQSFVPAAFIHRIAPTPLLMVVGDEDGCIPPPAQLDMFEKAKEPKQLHIMKGCGHFDVYHGKAFDENVNVQIEYLKKHLS